MGATWNDGDRRQLDELGISPEEIERQLDLFRQPPGFASLVRPCNVGDGIERLAEADVPALHAAHDAAAARGRFRKFVPASGAASRMFRELLWFQRGEGRRLDWAAVESRAGEGDARSAALVRFMREIERFAFFDDLKAVLADRGEDLADLVRRGKFGPVLNGLLGRGGLDYESLPKGLLRFHADAGGGRTSFEEHLVEAAGYVRDADGVCRMHLTVSPEHRSRFEQLFESAGPRLAGRHDARFEVEYSVQKPSTNTLAVDTANEPVRDAAGRLLLRPGGHGALIENLDDLGGDLVFVKNIDNVQPESRRAPTLAWKRALGGYLARLQAQIFEHLARLREPSPTRQSLERAAAFAAERLKLDVGGGRDRLVDRLDRPLRVCGVVPNTGEPGGGPFWVRDADGNVSRQIVEAAQVDPADEGQQSILRTSTHFNPVDLVCAVRDARGRVFDLKQFVDPRAVIISRKSEGGNDLRALELPGLWNGAMAHWNTVFIEVPIETFSPVKSVLDLLRDEHQPA